MAWNRGWSADDNLEPCFFVFCNSVMIYFGKVCTVGKKQTALKMILYELVGCKEDSMIIVVGENR